MAKWGEGDSRWLVEERNDGANVNSWHWEDKSMMGFAKTRLAELLEGLSLDVPDAGNKSASEQTQIKVTELKECSGECSISRRKKDKLLALFDLTLKLKWEASTPCEDAVAAEMPTETAEGEEGEEKGKGDAKAAKSVKGEITVKEFATGHDEIDDLEFSCTVTGKGERETAAKAALKKLYQPIFERLQQFDKELQSQDISSPTKK